MDDNTDAAQSLGTLCEHMGHEVDLAYDGLAGLDAARRSTPDVVFLDLGAAARWTESRWCGSCAPIRGCASALIIVLTGSGASKIGISCAKPAPTTTS